MEPEWLREVSDALRRCLAQPAEQILSSRPISVDERAAVAEHGAAVLAAIDRMLLSAAELKSSAIFEVVRELELELEGDSTNHDVWREILAWGRARSGSASQNHGLDTDDRVRFYEHDFYPLSNFSSFTLRWKGLRFDTSEAAYHWEKFPGYGDECKLTRDLILHAPSAHEAYRIAHRHRSCRRPNWDDVKVDVMREILRAKADQHEYVRRKLLATGERELVEDSWRDDFWGWGPSRDGKNWLGRLWMEIRAEIRASGRG